jgi:excinuclease ABC subunit A
VGQGNGENALKDIPESHTARYLLGTSNIAIPEFRKPFLNSIWIRGAKENNLKNIDVQFPLGVLTVITGVSGSGKSSLILKTLYPLVNAFVNGKAVFASDFELEAFSGLEHLDKVVDVDQSPIGQRPRSNPATYTGLFQFIRELFAQLPESKIRGYGPGRYSFNVAGGRCQTWEGDGMKKMEMHFLPPVFVPCEVCRTTRYSAETLAVRYKGKNIAEVLDMTVEDALSFFDSVPFLKSKLETLKEVGLGYLKLGQSSTTLSGGEAQRVKLAKELAKRATGKTIYILDEPSTGLHFDDVRQLVRILQSLVDRGNTVLVIEHNLDIIKMADHLMDLGPEGGLQGGFLLATGTPEEVAQNPQSVTGSFLRPYLSELVKRSG